MTEELVKYFTTQQLLEHVVNLINEFIALDKSPENKAALEERKAQLMLITKEIEARNTQTV